MEKEILEDVNTQAEIFVPVGVPPISAEYASLMLQGVSSVKDYGIFILDPNGYIRTWNLGAQNLKGYTAQEAIGMHFSNFYTEEANLRKYPEFELAVAKDHGQFEDEGWRKRKDGSLFWANVVITAVKDPTGKLLGYTKVTRDLTERKAMEEDLRQAKEEAEAARENYRLLVDGVRDYAIIMLDPNGIIASWNRGAERIKGYRADEIIGQHFSKFYLPLDVENGKCDFELKYARVEGQFEDEGWRVRKDGTTFWANVLITAIFNERNELLGFSKIVRDITEWKEKEQALRESEKRFRDMADKVMERTIQLEELNKEMEAFSYSVSHDLRAPLRTIDGFSQALLDLYSSSLDEKAVHYLNSIRKGSQDMGQLIDDLLQLSRLTRGLLDFDKEVNLSVMAEQIIQELRESEPERQVNIEIDPDLVVTADKRLMHAVLYNLFSNAWKFTSKHETAHIQFKRFMQDGVAVYYVRDDGAGFNMRYASKLFGAFQRLHGVKDFPGTGIGLATAQRIIHRHGGQIWAEAEVERGATFFFTFEPLTKKADTLDTVPQQKLKEERV